MFSFIYFIWAFHLSKETLPTALDSASSHPTPPLCIWTIKIFLRPDFGVLNGFLRSFDQSGGGLAWGASGGSKGGLGEALHTTQGGNTPVLYISTFLRTSSISFFLYHFMPSPLQSSLDRALEELSLSLMMKGVLPQSLNFHMLLLKLTYCFCLDTGYGMEETSTWHLRVGIWQFRAMGLSICSTSYPGALSKLVPSTLIHWSSQSVSKTFLGTYSMPGTELGTVGNR